MLDLVTRGDGRYPRADADTIVNALVDLAERLPDIRTHALGVADAWRRTNP